ncbi:hypothetical protein BU26DRAFT_575558, partial [Trematosphaeria pertusa]
LYSPLSSESKNPFVPALILRDAKLLIATQSNLRLPQAQRSQMCNLKELSFSCGHKQYSIVTACPTAFRFKATPVDLPPDFCRAVVSIEECVSLPKACKEGCRRAKALEALNRRYKEANDKIEKVSERVDAVQKCLSDGQAPKYAFPGLEEKGWDTQLLKKLCAVALTQVRRLLSEYSTVKKSVLTDLDAAFTAAKLTIGEYEIEISPGNVTRMVAFDGGALEQVGAELWEGLYDLVLEIERMASEACLEELGWEMPKEDEEQCEVLRDFGSWKVGVLSGSRMDDAFVGGGVDELETAEDIGHWSCGRRMTMTMTNGAEACGD